MIWWEPYWFDPNDPRYMRNQAVIDGTYDEYIRSFARDAKAFGDTILLRYAHQANSDYLPWGFGGGSDFGNTADTFRRMWRHVHRIFDDVGASNVKWVWTVATQTCGGDGKVVAFTVRNCMDRPVGYPGDAWVDYVGFTWENWGTAPAGSVIPSGPWTPLVAGLRPVVRALSAITRKPIIAAAVASAPGGGDRARWIRRGYKAVYEKLPKVVAIVWLNVDLSGSPNHHRDWSLRGRALAAYADVAARARFKGRIH
jgi:beta-mannanase